MRLPIPLPALFTRRERPRDLASLLAAVLSMKRRGDLARSCVYGEADGVFSSVKTETEACLCGRYVSDTRLFSVLNAVVRCAQSMRRHYVLFAHIQDIDAVLGRRSPGLARVLGKKGIPFRQEIVSVLSGAPVPDGVLAVRDGVSSDSPRTVYICPSRWSLYIEVYRPEPNRRSGYLVFLSRRW